MGEMIIISSIAWLCAVGELGDKRTCGAISLAACMDHLGLSTSAKELADDLPNGGDFVTLNDLAEVAHRNRLATRAVRWAEEIPVESPPAIIAVVVSGSRLHFIAVLESRGAQVLVRDGPNQLWEFTSELRRCGWDGCALHIARDPALLAAIVPRRWNSEQSIYAAAASLFSVAGFVVWRSRRRGAR
jgi:ABC-type bacteriocin/lantibiotic exporter with double-glycine peptidase domain